MAGVIASVAVPVTDGDVASILRVLDSELERREEYIDSRRSSIDSLKGLLVRRDASESLKLAVMLEIGDNYSAFNTDSAVLFFNEGYVRSIAQGLDSTAVRFALRTATYLPLQLRIERANENHGFHCHSRGAFWLEGGIFRCCAADVIVYWEFLRVLA